MRVSTLRGILLCSVALFPLAAKAQFGGTPQATSTSPGTVPNVGGNNGVVLLGANQQVPPANLPAVSALTGYVDPTNASNLASGTVPVVRLPPISQLIGFVDPTNASNLASGTVALARLPSIPYSQLSGAPSAGTMAGTYAAGNDSRIPSGTAGAAGGALIQGGSGPLDSNVAHTPAGAAVTVPAWADADGVLANLTCNSASDSATQSANAAALQAAINATLVASPEHRRYLIRLPPGRCFLPGGMVTIGDVEGSTALTRGKLRLEGAGKDNTELVISGSGDGILVQSGKVSLSSFTMTSDGSTRGFINTVVTATGAVAASNVMTITTKAAHGAVVGDTVIYTMASNGAYSYRGTVTSVPTSTTLTVAYTIGNGTVTGGNLRVLHTIGTGRGIAIDPGYSIGTTMADFEMHDVSIQGQPGDGFEAIDPELLLMQRVVAANNGGNGFQLNGSDYGSGQENNNNLLENIRGSGNGLAGILDYASVNGNVYVSAEALQNYGPIQFDINAGTGAAVLINPDIEAENIQAANGGTGSNQVGLRLGTAGGQVLGGLINAGSFAPVEIQQPRQRIVGTMLGNTAYPGNPNGSTGNYYTSYIIFAFGTLTDINVDVPLLGALAGNTQAVTNLPAILANNTNRIRLGTTILTPSMLSNAPAVTAAGTNLATAAALSADLSDVATVASGSGVALSGQVGQRQDVWNDGANALLVYPPSSSVAIGAGSLGAAVSVAVGAHAAFVCLTATVCRQAP